MDTDTKQNTGQSTGVTESKHPGSENLLPPWQPGESGNPAGRPTGQRNYATLYRLALLKVAKKNNLDPDDLELEIISNAILNARTGNYKFFKDMLDRLFGKAIQPIHGDVNHNVDSIAELIALVDGAKEEKRAKEAKDTQSAPEAIVASPAEDIDPANRPALPLPTE